MFLERATVNARCRCDVQVDDRVLKYFSRFVAPVSAAYIRMSGIFFCDAGAGAATAAVSKISRYRISCSIWSLVC